MQKIRIADFIIDRLNTKYGIKHISLLTGNGALVINDAIGKNKNITPVCVFHEQDAGYFCLGYSKYTNKLSVCNPTTGCAGTNVITPLLAAYQDHVPILFLSGNVALENTTRYINRKNNIKLKKLGVQELDIIEIVKPLTKYAAMVEEATKVKYELDKAIDIALTPPFGPVFVDIPANIGSALIDIDDFINYEKEEKHINCDCIKTDINSLKDKLNKCNRSLVLAGNGIVLSDTKQQFKEFVHKYKLPAVFTYGGIDILDFNDYLNIGVIGVKGSRSGNFAIQNCELLLVLGACLNIPQIGYMGGKFASLAEKIVVDLETSFNPGIKIDKLINCELNKFFEYVN